jgi:hypothetical protein
VKEGSNTSSVSLREVEDEEKGTLPGGITGPPCSLGI